MGLRIEGIKAFTVYLIHILISVGMETEELNNSCCSIPFFLYNTKIIGSHITYDHVQHAFRCSPIDSVRSLL